MTNPILLWAYDPNKPLWHPAILIRLVDGIRKEIPDFIWSVRNHWQEEKG